MASSSTLLKTTTSPSQRPLNPTSATTTKTTTATANATSASSAQPNLDDDQDALDDKDFAPDFELAFHDLSIRSSLFRTKLIEEFQLLENLGVSTTMAYPPQYNTCDVRDKPTFQKMLKENPCQLIKFQTLKRTQLHADIDRRLTRIRNKDKVPLGAWAAWVLESKAWELFLITVIIVNAIMVGIIAELSDSEADHVDLFRVLLYLDHFSLYVFYLEIGLKWLDKFNDYWKDAWNFFDFGITVATTIPELIGLFSTEDSSSSGNSFNLIVRQLRTFRILRTLKLAVRFRGLRIIVVTIFEAFKSMALIMLLLLMITFIFAIVGMSSFTPLLDYPFELRYKYSFSNLLNSFESLFQVLTLDNWQDLRDDLLVVLDPVLVYIFILAWVWIGAFIFKNLFVGVMVSNFNRISTELRKKEQAAAKAKKLEKMRRRLKKELAAVKSTFQPSASSDTHSTADTSTSRSRVSIPSDPNLVKSIPETPPPPRDDLKDLLSRSRGISKGWEQLIRENLLALTEKTEETLWPRDTLFKYFQLMETLQENMREYQELQGMANSILLEINDM